jgi:hypothetical protein
MVAHERVEYHWIEGRVVPTIVPRPSYVQKWRFDLSDDSLIATFETQDRSFFYRPGPAYSPSRLVDSIRLHTGVLTNDDLPDFSMRMPQPVQDELKRQVDNAVANIIEQWRTFAEETDITGHLKGELAKIRIERDGWTVHVKSWTYKRRPKENKMGADLGVVFDLSHEEERLIKAAWYQAKIDKGLALDQVEDLSDQIADMQVYTREAYTLLYSRDQIIAMRGMDPNDSKPLSENLVEGASCLRGDRNPLVIANTVDCKNVVTFFISA